MDDRAVDGLHGSPPTICSVTHRRAPELWGVFDDFAAAHHILPRNKVLKTLVLSSTANQ